MYREKVFLQLSADADNEYAMIDSTIVRAHQHSAGAQKKPARTRRSADHAGGLSTKIHALVDALGNPVNFFLTGGEAHDLVGADHLLPSMQADTLIADKAFDADERVIAPLAAAGKTAVIRPRRTERIASRLRPIHLPGASPHRELLRQTQAVSCHRHPLRQDRAQLPRRHPPDRRAYLAQLRTGPRDSLDAGQQLDPPCPAATAIVARTAAARSSLS